MRCVWVVTLQRQRTMAATAIALCTSIADSLALNSGGSAFGERFNLVKCGHGGVARERGEQSSFSLSEADAAIERFPAEALPGPEDEARGIDVLGVGGDAAEAEDDGRDGYCPLHFHSSQFSAEFGRIRLSRTI